MNPHLKLLQPYPFNRLWHLLEGIEPTSARHPLPFYIGEPQHAPPEFVLSALTENLDGFGRYPETIGSMELREAILHWLTNRYHLQDTDLSIDHLLPVNGTREALFAIAQVIADQQSGGLVAMPNPFYQIYEGAALLSGTTPFFLNCPAENDYLPDLEAVTPEQWRAVQMIYLCNPGNPSGAVMPLAKLQQLIALADQYDFVILSDECYSELYRDEQQPPPGLLQACREMGRNHFSRCLVFNSLSKRSNMPGFRSGLVAGDRDIIEAFLKFRTYHGCAMPLPIQKASAAAWKDENHVRANRQAYREKFEAVAPLLREEFDFSIPPAGFFLWLSLSVDDQEFTRVLYREENLIALPGSYLSRETREGNPGSNHLRLALVGTLENCVEGVGRTIDCHRRMAAK